MGKEWKKNPSNSAKQEICLSLEQKLRRKPGKKDQVDLFINKKSGTNPPRCHWSQCFAFGAFPLPHPKRRKPHNNSLPPPGRSERAPKLLIKEKTEPPRDHHIYTVFKSSRGDTLKWFMYSNSISLYLVANKVTCHGCKQWHRYPGLPLNVCRAQDNSPPWAGSPACLVSGSGSPGGQACTRRRKQTGDWAGEPRRPWAGGQCLLPMTCKLPQQLNRLLQLLRKQKRRTIHFS